jgi:hypothetical protein
MIICFQELLKKYRGKSFLGKNKLIITIPVTQEKLFTSLKTSLKNYFLNIFEQESIQIFFDKEIKKVYNEADDNYLSFQKNERMQYSYCYIQPKLVLPSYYRFSEINECSIIYRNEELGKDKHKFNYNDYDNIFALGDTLEHLPFERFYSNIFVQAHYVSQIVKSQHFRLNTSYNHFTSETLFLDYHLKEYQILDKNDNMINLKKNLLNKFWVDHLYLRPEGYYAKRFLKKNLNVKLS